MAELFRTERRRGVRQEEQNSVARLEGPWQLPRANHRQKDGAKSEVAFVWIAAGIKREHRRRA